MERSGPKQWARLRLLQACARLDIPNQLWPKIPFPNLPRRYIQSYSVSAPLELPSFFPVDESEAEWKARVQKAVNAFVEKELSRFREKLQSELKGGYLTRIKPTRDTTPLDLRYEWAAKRICYRTPYRDLAEEVAAKGYTQERIKRAVNLIIKETGLRQGK
jgi:hypothetical protein